MIETLKSLTLALSALILAFSAYFVGTNQPAPQLMAGVTVGNEYNATTTSNISGWPSVVRITGTTTAKSGVLGSIVHTGAGAAGGSIDIFDATTTSKLERTGQLATSSILLASIPNNASAGTYMFDVQFYRGLLVVISGTVGTTTITWR